MGSVHAIDQNKKDQTPVKIIADLDDFISQPIGFKFNGKGYQIPPIHVKDYLTIAKVYERTLGQIKNDSTTADEVYPLYYEFFSTICREITLEDVKSMTMKQLITLLNLFIEHISGKTQEYMVAVPEDAEKKKTLIPLVKKNRLKWAQFWRSFVTSIRSLIKKF